MSLVFINLKNLPNVSERRFMVSSNPGVCLRILVSKAISISRTWYDGMLPSMAIAIQLRYETGGMFKSVTALENSTGNDTCP